MMRFALTCTSCLIVALPAPFTDASADALVIVPVIGLSRCKPPGSFMSMVPVMLPLLIENTPPAPTAK